MKRFMALGTLVCAASLVYAAKVRVDFDHAVHFGSYRTYSWTATESQSPGAVFPNQLLRDRIAGYIEEALAARGLKRVPKGGDLLVGYRITVQEQPEWVTFYDGGSPGWGWGAGWDGGWGNAWGGGIATTTLQTYYDGTLVVNMMDANHGRLVFQATSTQSISSKPEKNTRIFCKAVNEVFEKYPPQP
jgi:Domain of unknown function (DUF4136)